MNETQETSKGKTRAERDFEKQMKEEAENLRKKQEQAMEDWKKKSKKSKVYLVIALFFLVLAIVGANLFAFSVQLGINPNPHFFDKVGTDVNGNEFTIFEASNGYVWLMKSYGTQLIVTAVVIVCSIILNYVIKSAITAFIGKTKKSQTIGSLIRSLMKYIFVIIALVIILAAWGVDVGSIIAGLGVLTLILGLGCQSLIQDIISGLFIVFDDYFDVGDICILDGFQGQITEIGLRSVRINDGIGNEKSITNSSINTVVNLSRAPYCVAVSFDVSYNEDLERVEGIIAKELPKIKKRLPMITDGPKYIGVDSFDNCGIMLKFVCFCDASNRFQVKRDFQREIYQMVKNNDIQYCFDTFVINPPDPTDLPKATDEEVRLSRMLNEKNRALPKKEKEKTILEKMSDSFGGHFQ